MRFASFLCVSCLAMASLMATSVVEAQTNPPSVDPLSSINNDIATNDWSPLLGASQATSVKQLTKDIYFAEFYGDAYDTGYVVAWTNAWGSVLMPTHLFNYWVHQQLFTDPQTGNTRFASLGFPEALSYNDPPFDISVVFTYGIIGSSNGTTYGISANIYNEWSRHPTNWGLPTNDPALESYFDPVAGTYLGVNGSTTDPATGLGWVGQTFVGGEIWTRYDASSRSRKTVGIQGPVHDAWVSQGLGDPLASTSDISGGSYSASNDAICQQFPPTGNTARTSGTADNDPVCLPRVEGTGLKGSFSKGDVYYADFPLGVHWTGGPHGGRGEPFVVPSQPQSANHKSLKSTYGGPKSWLGYPMGNAYIAPNTSDYVQQFEYGQMVMPSDGNGGYLDPITLGRFYFSFDMVQNLSGQTCVVDACWGPYWTAQYLVIADDIPVATRVLSDSSAETFSGNDQKRGPWQWLDLGQATDATHVVVTLNGTDYHDPIVQADPWDVGNGFYFVDFKSSNGWQLDQSPTYTSGFMTYQVHITNHVPVDATDNGYPMQGSQWWSFKNWNTAFIDRSTYIEAFGSPHNWWSDHGLPGFPAFSSLVGQSGQGGNCFGMSLLAIYSENGHSTWNEPIHQWPVNQPQPDQPLDQSFADGGAPQAVALAHDINIMNAYQLGSQSIGQLLKSYRADNVSNITAIEKTLLAQRPVLVAITTDEYVGYSHALRAYRVDLNQPCTWLGPHECERIYVQDPNWPDRATKPLAGHDGLGNPTTTHEPYIEVTSDHLQWSYQWYHPDKAPSDVYWQGTQLPGAADMCTNLPPWKSPPPECTRYEGGRIYFMPYDNVLDSTPGVPDWLYNNFGNPVPGELKDQLAHFSFGSAQVAQITDETGKTFYASPSDGAQTLGRQLTDRAARTQRVVPIPMFGDSGSYSVNPILAAILEPQSSVTFDLTLPAGLASGSQYQMLQMSPALSVLLQAPGTAGVTEQLTLSMPDSQSTLATFKLPANDNAQTIAWILSGYDKTVTYQMSNLTVAPSQALTAFFENGSKRFRIENNGPTTTADVAIGTGGQAPVAAGSYQLLTGDNSFDLSSTSTGQPNLLVSPLSANGVLGFESASGWTNSDAGLQIAGQPRTQGNFALLVKNPGWHEIWSARFNTSLLQNITSTLAVDVYVPSGPSNPWWLGAVQMYADCPSANVYHAYMGQVELTGNPSGAYMTAKFTVPSSVVAAMQASHSDFAFSIAVNVPPAAESLAFDDLRFQASGIGSL